MSGLEIIFALSNSDGTPSQNQYWAYSLQYVAKLVYYFECSVLTNNKAKKNKNKKEAFFAIIIRWKYTVSVWGWNSAQDGNEGFPPLGSKLDNNENRFVIFGS